MVNGLVYWVIIAFVGLIGIGILYIGAKVIFSLAFPTTSNKIEVYFLSRDVKRYFGFLLEKGYRIADLRNDSGYQRGWHCRLESPDNKLGIVLDEELRRALLLFGNSNEENRYQIFLEEMIYYLTERKVFIGNSYDNAFVGRRKQFKQIAKLLKSYIFQIESHLAGDLEELKVELSKPKEQYTKLLEQEFTNWFNRGQNK